MDKVVSAVTGALEAQAMTGRAMLAWDRATVVPADAVAMVVVAVTVSVGAADGRLESPASRRFQI